MSSSTPPDELSTLDPTPTSANPLNAAVSQQPPPPMPPRPLSPMEQAKVTLKEAFPGVEESIIEAVLIASGGRIEPAFNALLAMTDPSYKPETNEASIEHSDTTVPLQQTSTPLSQLEQDEQLARQLAGEGHSRRQDRRFSRDRQRPPQQQRRQEQGQEKEHSFIDDDLPIIRDNIKKGWSTFLGKVKSKLEGEPDPPMPPSRPVEYGYSRQQTARYDADPRVLGDDFSHLNIQDPNRRSSQGQSNRPLANPNLFKTTRFSTGEASENTAPPPKPPRPESQSVSALSSQPPSQSVGGPSPSKKWEPLRPAEDRDPFAVGDSDDEESKDDLYGTTTSSDKPSSSAGGIGGTTVSSQSDSAPGTIGKSS